MNANLKEYIRLCSIPTVQEKIRERMGKIQLDDLVIVPCNDTPTRVTCVCELCTPYNSIRLPQAIDLMDEKRGLWGWLDWLNWLIDVDGENHITLSEIGTNFKAEGTPELALLRALMWQSGIEEVKG